MVNQKAGSVQLLSLAISYLIVARGVYAQQPAFPQPAFPQPSGQGGAQPVLAQPAFPQPVGQGNTQPAFPQPANPGGNQPAFPQPSGQGGAQPAFPQPSGQGNVQPAFPQPAFPQPANPTGNQPAFPQPVNPTGNQPAFPQPSGPGSSQPVSPSPGPVQGSPSPPVTTNPDCPNGTGSVYQAPDGSWYYLQCNYHGWTGSRTDVDATSYQDCIDKCSETPLCLGINWSHADKKTCSLMSTNQPGDTPCENHDYAFLIDPPTEPQEPEKRTLCSTDCPSADHMQYTSQYGETFKMNCGKRHGTAYLDTIQKDTLKDCMDACAALVPCHSVDYHGRTKKCYLSDHQGEPTIPAPGFSSAYSLGCAGACSTCGCNKAASGATTQSP